MFLLQSSFYEVEATSAFRNDCSNKKIARQAHFSSCYTSNDLRNLCRNKIARKVARKNA